MPAATKMTVRNQPRLRGKTAGPTINAKMLRSQKSQRQILDAAARVFATSGFDGASMRQIAEEANVTQSLLHHHFQTKQRLFQTVCAKHAESVNKRRRFVTQQYLDGKIDSNFGLEHLIRTLVQPWIDAVNDPDPNWAIFSRFIIRSAFSDEEWSQEYAVKYLGHLGDLAEKAVRKALPEFSQKDAVWAYCLTLSMFSMALAAPKRMKGVTKGKINPDNMEELEEYGFEFALAGIQAIRDKSRKLKSEQALTLSDYSQ